MAHKETVSYHNASGLYCRTLGLTLTGIKPKFWLGADEAEALRRAERLEILWGQVQQDWTTLPAEYPDWLETTLLRKPERPLWDDLTLPAAKGIAKGHVDFPLPRKASWSPYQYTTRLAKMQRRFPAVSFCPAEEEKGYHETGATLLTTEAEQEIRGGKEKLALVAGRTSGQTFHQALDAYADHLKKLPDRSGWYRTQIKQTKRLKENHPDMPLPQLGLSKLEEMVNYWRHRPFIRGKVIAYDTARNQVIQLFMVLKWIDRSDAFDWRRPRGFEDIKQTVKDADGDNIGPKVETFTLDELRMLWTYASPLVRLQMVLALNCGFKYAEIASLTLADIALASPYLGVVRVDVPGVGHWITRRRRKTKVYGEWSLWDVTAAGIEWVIKNRRRPVKGEGDPLLVTRSGRAMDAQTASGNKSDKMYNSWRNLYRTLGSEGGGSAVPEF